MYTYVYDISSIPTCYEIMKYGGHDFHELDFRGTREHHRSCCSSLDVKHCQQMKLPKNGKLIKEVTQDIYIYMHIYLYILYVYIMYIFMLDI